jgi:hypothetical protein
MAPGPVPSAVYWWSRELEAKFWLLHCYPQSHVSRRDIYGQFRLKKATPDQVYEHGGTARPQGESIDKIYHGWIICNRIKITLYCM